MHFATSKCLLLLLMVFGVFAQYPPNQFQNGRQQASFQSGNSQQGSFQSGGYQTGGAAQQRYQQGRVVVGPGPVNPYGGQFNEQRVINIHEDIQGSASQGGAGYAYGSGQYSQSGAGYQGGYQAGQAGSAAGFQQRSGTSGRSVVVNSPVMLDTAADGGIKGAQVDLRLITYSNPGLTLPNQTTCNCPINNCNFVPSNQQNQCQFSFVIVISAADQSIQYIQSNFYPVPGNGIISQGNWTNQYSFQMNTKPVAIDIFVQHLGVVIDGHSGQLLFFNHLSLVDSFVVDLLGFNQNGQQGQQSLTLRGQLQNTQLQMALNVQCINNMLGPYCDLNCNSTNAQANALVICFSNRTDTYSACKWNTYRNQVVDCFVCTHGVFNGTCSGAVIANNGGVAYAFRTWTIVLGCLLGIALLLILCLIISYIIIINRRNEQRETAVYKESYMNDNYDSKYKSNKSETGSDQPLISNEEWSSSTTTKKPISILSQKNQPKDRRSSAQFQSQQHQQSSQYQQSQQGSEYERRQLATPESEESYQTNGQVQQTTTTTTTTTRREQVV